jgi:hypothetical protein
MLRLGSVGEEVRRLQARLKELGFYKGAIDGVFGGATESAVKRFQKANALKVDGIVVPKTYDAPFVNVSESVNVDVDEPHTHPHQSPLTSHFSPLTAHSSPNYLLIIAVLCLKGHLRQGRLHLSVSLQYLAILMVRV